MERKTYTDEQLFHAFSNGYPYDVLVEVERIISENAFRVLKEYCDEEFAIAHYKVVGQELFIKLCKLDAENKIANHKNFPGYVYECGKYLVLNYVKSHRRKEKKTTPLTDNMMLVLEQIDRDIDEQIDNADFLREVLKFMNDPHNIRPEIAKALLERYAADRKIKDIAQEIGMKPNSLTRALLKAKKIIKTRFLSDYARHHRKI